MAATATDCGGVAESLFMRSSPASFRAPRPRAASGKAGRQNMAVRRPRLAAAGQDAGWRCCCRLETLPACSISSTRAARRAALRGHRLALVRPTQLAQDLSVPSPQIHFLSKAASAVFWLSCVWTNSLFYHARHEPHAPVRSLSLSALLYGQYTACVHHCSVSPCPTRASPPRARPRRAPARRRASPPSSARARSAPLSLWRPSCRPTA